MKRSNVTSLLLLLLLLLQLLMAPQHATSSRFYFRQIVLRRAGVVSKQFHLSKSLQKSRFARSFTDSQNDDYVSSLL